MFHNAPFDVSFLNVELGNVAYNRLNVDDVFDTKVFAEEMQQLRPSQFTPDSTSLDALCRHFNIDTTHRQIHGAIKDCELTYRVYSKLMSLA